MALSALEGVTPVSHGGNVEAIARQFGLGPDSIIDFSANINPAGLPPRAAERLAREARDPHLLARYPDTDARELRAALAVRLEVPIESIVVGAGGDALIHAAIRAFAPRECLVPVPAFMEYERACAASGTPVRRIPLGGADGFTLPTQWWRDLAAGSMIVFNNPHNPTGACTSAADMLDRIAAARSSGATVLVDEAFVDYAPAAAVTGHAAQQQGVIAIRSLTKFYGCPALRVGYAIASPGTACDLRRQLPPWPVTTLAANALAEAVADDEYSRATLENNERQRFWLGRELTALQFHTFPSAANFQLVEVPAAVSASDLRESLLRNWRILVRECDSFTGLTRDRYLRVAVRGAKDNAALIRALSGYLDNSSGGKTAGGAGA
jgi:threonine-phosphate decarboxylase